MKSVSRGGRDWGVKERRNEKKRGKRGFAEIAGQKTE